MDDRHVGIGRMKFWKGYDPFNGTGGIDPFAPLTMVEPVSRNVANKKEISGNFQADGMQGDPTVDGISIKRFGKYEIVTVESENYSQGTAGTVPDQPPDVPVPPVPDKECCDSLYVDYWSLMSSGDSQNMAAQPSLYGCVYWWEILECYPSTFNCGVLSHHPAGSTARGVIYTAPTIPGDVYSCEKSVRVKLRVSILQSDGPNKKASDKQAMWRSIDLISGEDIPTGPVVCWKDFTLSVEGPACAKPDYCLTPSYINFTSHTMGVSQTQALGVTGGGSTPDELFTWELSGGGSLSNTSGRSTVYTSPSSNANCANNGTIKLYCNGMYQDSLTISVNQDSTDYNAYRLISGISSYCKTYFLGGYWHCHYSTYYTSTYIRCDGTVRSTANLEVCDVDGGCDFWACSKLQTSHETCCATYYGGDCEGYASSLYADLRTEAQKAAGCCPSLL
jgi:hypothetical protein